MDGFTYKNQKKLRKGYTTGTCGAAAAKAAAYMLFCGRKVDEVTIRTPSGVCLCLPVCDAEIEEGYACCGIVKDSGDDPDITNGITIYAKVLYIQTIHEEERIAIDGGEGIGRVTKAGLNQPVGAAAINEVPRRMIREAVGEIMEEAGYTGGVKVIIFAPQGRELAEKTFNPRLGIEGGISILGTSGIVEPMSEQALIDTIRTELEQRLAEGKKILLITPGNYGHGYAVDMLHLQEQADVSCSNYIGETLDMAVAMGFEQILLVGNIGKLIKLAGGIFQTHSKVADCRMELIAVHAALCGAGTQLLQDIMGCVMTDAALELLKGHGLLEPVMERIVTAVDGKIKLRTGGAIKTGVFLFSEKMGLLGETRDARSILDAIKENGE